MHPPLVGYLVVASKIVLPVGLEVRRGRNQIINLQPLRGKAITEVFHPAIVEHAVDLTCENLRIFQLALSGQCQQLVIRDRTPKEKGQAGRQIIRIVIGRGAIGLVMYHDESWRCQGS